jgi:hypothetical protein
MATGKQYRLERWSVGIRNDDGYTAPELLIRYLQGRRDDGKSVRTSGIRTVAGNVVQTESGSIYKLGEPDPDYLEHLRSIGFEFDPAEPIKMRS